MWWENYRKEWWRDYYGKPWSAVPNPPESYSCGELVRTILWDLHKQHVEMIVADPAVLRQCMRDLSNITRYGLRPLTADERPTECDVVFMCRGTRDDHVGMVVDTQEGQLILHCMQHAGTVLDSEVEMRAMGYHRLLYTRHVGYVPFPGVAHG